MNQSHDDDEDDEEHDVKIWQHMLWREGKWGKITFPIDNVTH